MNGRLRAALVLATATIGVTAAIGMRRAPVGTAAAPVPVDPDSGLIAHEWGTFTSVAGEDGHAMLWHPLYTQSDLPCFVRIVNPDGLKNIVPALPATVRMETPVIYFYSHSPRTVRVKVGMRQGMITEWYPRAVVTPFSAQLLDRASNDLVWDSVHVVPGPDADYPRERAASHYYAARETDALPLRVGDEHEKFLFYRGLGGFDVPLTVTADSSGQIHVTNTGRETIPWIILFEKRGDAMGYRVVRDLEERVAVSAPALVDSFPALARSLETLLVEEGLYPREAKAMVETWRDSWFESGTRLFYIAPATLVDSVVPLTIRPRPTRTERVFVGRIEVVTRRMIDDVVMLVREGNHDALAGYGRALGEIMGRAGARLTKSDIAAVSKEMSEREPSEHRCSGPLRIKRVRRY